MSQAQGLSDLNGSYDTLLSTFDAVFLSAELSALVAGLDIRTGVWSNQADHLTLDGMGIATNYGANVSIANVHQQHRLLFRYGIANKNVSEVARTVGLSYQYFSRLMSAGAGVVKNIASSQLTHINVKDSVFVEVYINYQVQPQLFLTVSLQNITASELGLANVADSNASIATVRLSYEF